MSDLPPAPEAAGPIPAATHLLPPLITVAGDLLDDVVVWTRGPVRQGTDNPATVHRSRGGSAANVAAAVATAGGRARFVGCVGDDATGRRLAEELASAGADVRVQHRGTTGCVVVLVDATGERTMFPSRGAAGELREIDRAWLTGTAVLHLPAYGFLTPTAATSLLGAADVARGLGAAITLDVSATSAVEAIGRGEFLALVQRLHPEVLLANADEAAVLGLGRGAPLDAVRVHIVKDGPRPALVIGADGSAVEVPVPPVPDVRDTTGAGDAFAAGFLVAWASGTAPTGAVVAGHRSAAAVLTVPGSGSAAGGAHAGGA